MMMASTSPRTRRPYVRAKKYRSRVLVCIGSPDAERGDRLVLQDDGNLVIYNSTTSAAVWDSGTAEYIGPNRIVLR